ncbi:hypothetical protein PFMG_00800 [Plasmodium falciparum IGH-CR14]|uniref:Uncharacterized protein n=1 Tax=Plasmodium falciparum IGH-CR14 TaxID=580059 RepID=A0A0L1I4P6_PLAFA|nr:hypothetical protein PFMG_00800 [Plasmodium falciparum IGH-CR14]
MKKNHTRYCDKNNDILISKQKIEDLKKSIENLLNDKNAHYELNHIKRSLNELDIYTKNKSDLFNNYNLNESLNDSYKDKTFEELKSQLIKQKNLNSCLSLKLKSIHIKLNNLFLKKNEFEKTINNKIKEIELQFLIIQNVTHENKGIPISKELKEQEKHLQNSHENVAIYDTHEIENNDKKKLYTNFHNEEKDHLKCLLEEYSKTLEIYKMGKIQLEFELKCCKEKLNEEIEKNNNYNNKMKSYEIHIDVVKNENCKNLEELNDLKLQLEKTKSENNQNYVKNKILNDEKNNLDKINNDLKIKIKNFKTLLNDAQNKEYILNNFTQKIFNIITYLKNNDEHNFLNDKIHNKLDINQDQIYVQTELYIDIISSSIRNLINFKKTLEERNVELEKVTHEMKELRKELILKKKNYEELRLKLNHLECVERDSVKINSEKEKGEKVIYELKEKLDNDEKIINDLKKKNSYQVYKMKDYEKRENNLINEINKLKLFIEENKMTVERGNEMNNKKLEEMKQKNKELINNLNDISDELKNCIEQVNSVSRNMANVEKEKENIINELQILRMKNDTMRKRISKFEEQEKVLKFKLYTLNNDIFSKNEKLNDMQKKLNDVNEKYKNIVECLNNYKTEHKEQIEKKIERINTLKQNYYYLKKEYDLKNKELEKNIEHGKKLEHELSHCYEENQKLNEEIKRRNSFIKNKDRKIDLLTNIENELLKKKEINNIKLMEKQNVIKNNEQLLKDIKDENEKMNEHVNKLQNELIKRELQNKCISKDIEFCKKEKEDKIKNLEDDLLEKKKCIENLKDELINIKKKMEDKMHMTNEMDLLSNKVEELNRINKTYEKNIVELNNELDVIKKKLNDEEFLKEEEKKKNIDMVYKIKEYEIQIKEKENEIDSLKKNEQNLHVLKNEELNEKEIILKNKYDKEINMIIEQYNKKIQEEKDMLNNKIKSMDQTHKNQIEEMQEENKKELKRLKNVCDMNLQSQILIKENEKHMQEKVEEYKNLLKQKDQELKNIIQEYDERIEIQNKEMEDIVNDCEEKLKQAKINNKKLTTATNMANNNNMLMDENLKEKDKKINDLMKDMEKKKEEINKLVEEKSKLEHSHVKIQNEMSLLVEQNEKLKEEMGLSRIAIKDMEEIKKDMEKYEEEKKKNEEERKKNEEERKKNEEERKKNEEEKKKNEEERKKNEEEKKKLEKDKHQFEEEKERMEIYEHQKEDRKRKDKKKKGHSSDKEEKYNKKEKTKEKSSNILFDEEYIIQLEELRDTGENCFIYLKSLSKELDVIINKLKSKDDALLNDAFNKINLAITSWNIFNEENKEGDNITTVENTATEGNITIDENTTEVEMNNEEVYKIFSVEKYDMLKKEVGEKVECIQKLIG